MGKKKRKLDQEGSKKKPKKEVEELDYAKDVEGVMHAGEMYLIDGRRRMVFNGLTRQRVGDWDPVDRCLIINGKRTPLDDSSAFPFPTDPDDHCETPQVAYNDIAPVLKWLKGDLYDPYYCNGGAKVKLQGMGFTIRHEKEDCYKVWNSINFDILITNPPYSGDHLDRLIDFSFRSKKPFCWLVPEWVHKRPAFVTALGPSPRTKKRPLYLSPKKRYIYEPPPSMREAKASDTHKKTAPFHSIWIVWAGTQQLTDDLAKVASTLSAFRIARSQSQLRDLRRKIKAEEPSAPAPPPAPAQPITTTTTTEEDPPNDDDVPAVATSSSRPQSRAAHLRRRLLRKKTILKRNV